MHAGLLPPYTECCITCAMRPGNRRTSRLQITLTVEARRLLARLAQGRGLSMSAVLETLVRRESEPKKETDR